MNRLVNLFRSERPFHRGLLALNKSPLRHVIKRGLSWTQKTSKSQRREAARSMLLSPSEQQVVNCLSESGYAYLSETALSCELMKALQKDALERLGHSTQIPQTVSTKSFWKSLLDSEVENGTLNEFSIYVRVALQPTVIRVVSRYLGEVPSLSYVFLSLSMPSLEPLAVSQLWHMDKDDTKVVKVFTYLSDVTSLEDGPFTFLPKRVSARVRNSFFHRHLADEEVFRTVKPSEKVEMLAPKLTTFLVDTSRCYHMGSRLGEGHSRLIYTAAFTTVPCIYPKTHHGIRVAGELDPLSHLLLCP